MGRGGRRGQLRGGLSGVWKASEWSDAPPSSAYSHACCSTSQILTAFTFPSLCCRHDANVFVLLLLVYVNALCFRKVLLSLVFFSFCFFSSLFLRLFFFLFNIFFSFRFVFLISSLIYFFSINFTFFLHFQSLFTFVLSSSPFSPSLSISILLLLLHLYPFSILYSLHLHLFPIASVYYFLRLLVKIVGFSGSSLAVWPITFVHWIQGKSRTAKELEYV